MEKETKEAYWAGFTRALVLVFGSNVKWTNEERRTGNKVTRRFFGKKRNKK